LSVAFEPIVAVAPQPPPRAKRQTVPQLRVSELLGALSHALDITEGQPEGHCIRATWIGIQIGEALNLPPHELRDLYYTILLKDLGCSSNAARISALYLTDDLTFKHDHKVIGDSLPQVLRFVLRHTGTNSGLVERLQGVLNVAVHGGEISRDLIATRCERGADIARKLRFPEAVADGIRNLDEHWDGKGKASGAAGEAIPLGARIALLAQVVDVFHSTGGREAAMAEVRLRCATWFDPDLVFAFERVAAAPGFWETLASPSIENLVFDLAPAKIARAVDERYLDDVAAAFAGIVDAKSPYTAGHSTRVADYADMIAVELGLPEGRRRWLRRAALLHDIGKLGVSNTILDKPGKLTEAEWKAMRGHAAMSEAILSRIEAFDALARVAGAHHERLDGKGYPRGLPAPRISLDTRAMTVADVYDALTAKRPYREALPSAQAFRIMAKEVGTAFDGRCFEALRSAVTKRQLFEC
jgi:HD-GYP domain-containing protein (c-di-GMP phosphodiesterase class II)